MTTRNTSSRVTCIDFYVDNLITASLTATSTTVFTGPTPVLEVRHLTKYFPYNTQTSSQHICALEDATFCLKAGGIVALVGEAGSGKSTLARLIARLMPPTGGEIILHGRDVLKTEPRGPSFAYRSKVQLIFQDPSGSLNGAQTIGHHLERPLLIHAPVKDRHELQEKVYALLAAVGLTPPDEMAKKLPDQLLSGQHQRVALARALASDPDVILADEPIAPLDVSIRMSLLKLLAQLKRNRRIAYLYLTRDMASARYIADETIVMHAGHLVEGAASKELMREPAHPYTQWLLAALPGPRADGARRMIDVRGTDPSRINPPLGCPFVTRCPLALKVCREVMPEIIPLTARHWTRCHLYSDDNWLRRT